MRTTVGQLLVNEALPEDLRDYQRKMDKKGLQETLRLAADKHPEQYRDIVKNLSDVGRDVSTFEGSSISLDDLRPAEIKNKVIGALRMRVAEIVNDNKIPADKKNDMILEETSKLLGKLDDAVHEEGMTANNILSHMVASGARGNKSNVNQMRGAALIVADHRNRAIPVPILNSYAEGLDPVELWATSYGVRKGYVDLKTATPKAGFFGKQLANAAHRLIVRGERPIDGVGLPVDTVDPDNEGAVLARDYGDHKAGTIITPRIRKQLVEKYPTILIHSPIAAPIAGGGIPQWAVGVRERGGLSPIGDNVGVAAAQAISEPLSQSVISSKHIAGVVGGSTAHGAGGSTQAGFEAINRMANIPKTFEDQATVANLDGSISRVEDAPQGGKYVYIGNERHYVLPGQELTVKSGQQVEAGDVMSSGLPNPSEIVKHKGIGEGRRVFMQSLQQTLKNSGVRVNRRNVELMARALINHVRVTDTDGPEGSLPDDILEYDDFAARYVPRPGSAAMKTAGAKGRYLEQPVLHYSIGTRITPRVIGMLKDHGVDDIMVHNDPPGFEPEQQRAMDVMSKDPDWMTRLGGFHLEKNFLDSVHRGLKSEEHSTSYLPSLAKAVEFGKAPNKIGY